MLQMFDDNDGLFTCYIYAYMLFKPMLSIIYNLCNPRCVDLIDMLTQKQKVQPKAPPSQGTNQLPRIQTILDT